MKKVQKVEYLFEFLRVFLGVVLAFLSCIVIIVLISDENAGGAVYNFVVGPFMSKRRFAQVLSRWAPYMLTGCAMCFIYACGRFSLIPEGIINLAPIPACLLMFGTSLMVDLPQIVNLFIIIAICAFAGGLISMVPAFGRERLGANEMVTSTIMNYMCLYIALWLLKSTVADRNQSFLTTPVFPDNMRFTRYWGDTNFTGAIWVSIIGVIVACVIFYRTPLGTKIRLCGSNLQFAIYSGINAKKMMYIAQLLGGLFAGVAAAVDCFGLYNSYFYTMLTNVGMDGLLCAVMARKQPLFVPLTAFVMAYIRTAASVLNANTNIPIELVTMLQAVIVLFVAAEEFLGSSKRKVIFRISREEEAAKLAAKEVAGNG